MALEQGDPLNEKVHYSFWPKKMKKRHTLFAPYHSVSINKTVTSIPKMKRVEPSYSVLGHEKKL